jgi:EAL domain-containing protein (putative c-di-GMP-specific phosphodiesterase class I)
MRNTSGVIAAMEKLRRVGFRFALDDFGSGYSALSYINRLPIDVLKIDRSFVVRAVSGPGDEKMLRTLVNLAHELGMLVVIEGVETAEQVELVRTMGPVRMQGYFFAHPMPAEKLPAWARQVGAGTRPVP